MGMTMIGYKPVLRRSPNAEPGRAVLLRKRLATGWALLCVVLSGCLLAGSGGAAENTDDLVKPSLILESRTVQPGDTVTIGLRLEMKPGWHTYWRNSGDAGLPTTVAWTLPPGVTAGPLIWPKPERFTVATITNYGYTGIVVLPTELHVPADFTGNRLDLTAAVNWLACTDICIPGSATLSANFGIGGMVPDPAAAPALAASRQAVPAAARFETTFALAPSRIRLQVPATAYDGLTDPKAMFLPYDGGIIEDSAPQGQALSADGLIVTLMRAAPGPASSTAAPPTLDGVLVIDGLASGRPDTRAVEISANPVAMTTSPVDDISWEAALVLALLGGLVLNVMPCVFPVLSLKLLGLAQQADARPSVRLSHAAAYAAGILVCFAGLGALMLVLRAGGHEVGWGFQLQSPGFVGALAYLLFGMGLWMSGLTGGFGGLVGSGLIGIGDGLTRRPGWGGAFFTGMLATVVATPCTAPFMGAALGFAMAASPPLALGVFLALGIGLAAPYVLISALPGLGRLLPRPGRWMETVKQALAFPLYGTAAWLVWVLSQQTGPMGLLAVLGGLVLIGFACWCVGRTASAGKLGRSIGRGLGTVAVLAAVSLLITGALGRDGFEERAVGARDISGGRNAAVARSGLAYEPFSQRRLAALRASGQPVFVDMTAAWCITCLVNERTSLDSAAVRDAFERRGVVALKGDWTNQNPEITQLLQQFRRSGVPLYVFFDGANPPVLLPQILTETALLDVVGRS